MRNIFAILPLKRNYLFFILVFIFVGSTYFVAQAAWATIDTDNTVVDTAAWDSTNVNPVYSPTPECDDGNIDDDEEIRYGYIANDGSNFYFRIQTCDGPAISSSLRRVIAGFDCSDPPNNNFEDSEDRIALWYEFSGGDTVWLYSGSGSEIEQLLNEGGTGSEFGERVGVDGTSIEWQIPIEFIEQDRDSDWPGCDLTSINRPIGLATIAVNIFPPSYDLIDQTEPYLWDQPTVIELTEMRGSATNGSAKYILLSFGTLLLVGFVIFKIRGIK